MLDVQEYELVSTVCPDCGGTLIDYDDYAMCEYVDPFEDLAFVGVVGCGWIEREPVDFGKRRGVGLFAGGEWTYQRNLPVEPADDDDEYPEGWEHDTFYRHEVVYASRAEGTYTPHAPTPCGQGEPKGEWTDPLPERVTVEHQGYTVVHVDPVPLAELRDPDWKYGFGGMYRDAEGAAAQVTYHDGEPVVPEQPVIDWRQYPWHWERNADDQQTGVAGHYTPHEAGKRRRAIALRVHREVTARLS
jgi:hypothetical protein